MCYVCEMETALKEFIFTAATLFLTGSGLKPKKPNTKCLYNLPFEPGILHIRRMGIGIHLFLRLGPLNWHVSCEDSLGCHG
jgi:hypothetical protein